MNHKPMLAVDCGPLEELTFPLIASPKLDGVRAIITANGVLSRSLKRIPNEKVQDLLRGLPIGLDGELIVGPVTAKDAYRRTVSVVMSDDKPIDGLVFHVFDIQQDGHTFDARHVMMHYMAALIGNPNVQVVPQTTVQSLTELTELEADTVAEGHEGLILRKLDSPYKHGRSTVKEGYLLKLKRFQDGEAVVIGVTELQHNGNEAKTNELGRTARSHKKEGMTGAGVMGTLVVRDVKTGVEFEIGTGFTAEEREIVWRSWGINPKAWPLCKYKHFPVGAKDKPRHPVFLGWRDRRDT
jgi:DNA ligase-1